MKASALRDYEALDDLALARLIAARDPEAVRIVTARNNQRLFRAAWSVLRNRADAEDCVQSAYLKAFAAIGGFEGRAALSTWLTRIAINEALLRKRRAERQRRAIESHSVTLIDDYREKLMRGSSVPSPDRALARTELRRILEQAVAELPDAFRLVFVLREIEGLSIEETSEALGVAPATVKTRHFRARQKLQQALAPEMKASLESAFEFAGADCERISARVVAAFCPA